MANTASPQKMMARVINNCEDRETGSLKVIDSNHANVHRGDAFVAWHDHDTGLPDEASCDYELMVGQHAAAHVQFVDATLKSGSLLMVQVYENAVCLGGLSMPVQNRNRLEYFSDNRSNVTARSKVTTKLTGKLIDEFFVGRLRNSEGNGKDSFEMLFKPGTKYMFRVINKSDAPAYVHLRMGWFDRAVK